MAERIGQKERNNTSYHMTYDTYLALQQRLREKREQMQAAGIEAGEAAGPGSDWHDNPAYDDAVQRRNRLNGEVVRFNTLTVNAQFIYARTETNTAGVGNKVVLQFDGEDAACDYHILGPEDATLMPDSVISCASPLGKALIGASAGSTVSYIANNRTLTADLKAIMPGTFANPPAK